MAWFVKRVIKQSLHQRSFRFFSLGTRSFSAEQDYSDQFSESETDWDMLYRREIPKDVQEMSKVLGGRVDSPPDAKLLKVAVIGVPNSGKSTLINSLIRWRVCSVSSKVHTTKVNARAILNHGSTQLVFLDTPGIVTKEEVTKHGLARPLFLGAEESFSNADLIAVVHDMSNKFTRDQLHPQLLTLLALYPSMPSILILNKLDVLKSKRCLLEVTRVLTEGIVGGKVAHENRIKHEKLDKEKLIEKALRKERIKADRKKKVLGEEIEHIPSSDTDKIVSNESIEESFDISRNLKESQVYEAVKDRKGWPHFQDVFMISALQEYGVDDLRKYFLAKAYSASWLFNPMVVTDQNPEEIALATVREKFLERFPREIPYVLTFNVEYWDISESDLLNIGVEVKCKQRRLVQYLTKGRGYRIDGVISEAEYELRKTFRIPVTLNINVVQDMSLNN